ncbi:MAG: sensor histidine kinase, partial [Angelakisella sp.]
AAQIARKDYSNAESIPKIELNKYPWSFKKRLVLYFVGTVVIPTLAYGALVNHRLYVFSSGQTNIQFHYAAAQMENNLSYQVERLENIINVMTAPEVFKLLATKPTSLNSTEKEQIDKSLAKNSLTISNVKYFVLLGPGGTAKYQSLYSSNNSDIKNSNGNIIKFSLSNALISEYFENGQDMFWLESLKDIFNNPSLSLVRRITSVNDDKTTVGYFQMVLSSSVFQSVGKPFGYDFVITDAAGVPFYNSRNDSKYHNFILGMGQKQRDKPSTIEVIDGIKTMMVQEPVSKTDWKMCVFQRVDDLTAANMIMLRDSVLLTAAICLVIFLISLKLASLLAKPFNILQEDLQQVVNNKAFNQPLVYKGYSEMQDFIRMYNVMIRQIKQLIDDNIAISLREQEHITLKTQAELNMLQQQINPHFLYNTLEVINMQVKKSGELSASKMLEALAQIFRFSTRTDNKLVRLEQEIDHVKNYITIQMIRFENKFEVEYDIAEEALGIEVLKIILQPIVENAINHGLYEYITGGLLKISASITGDTLILSVRDNGIGMREPELAALRAGLLSDKTEAVKSKKGSGIALKNVYRRLDIYYAGKAKMTVESKFSKGTTVTIVIPIVHDTLENGTA